MKKPEVRAMTRAIAAGVTLPLWAGWQRAYVAGDSLEVVAGRAGVTGPTMAKWLRMGGVTIRRNGRRKGNTGGTPVPRRRLS